MLTRCEAAPIPQFWPPLSVGGRLMDMAIEGECGGVAPPPIPGEPRPPPAVMTHIFQPSGIGGCAVSQVEIHGGAHMHRTRNDTSVNM